MARRDRDERRQERRDREALEPHAVWLGSRLLPYFATLGLLVVIGTSTPGGQGMAVPLAATALFWGAGIGRGFLRRLQRRQELLTGPQGGLPVSPPAAASEPAAEVTPDELRELVALCERVRQALREQGQEGLAGRLAVGLAEVRRLHTLLQASRAGAHEEEELRAEVERLIAKADAARDEEARALWTRNASTANRRLQKLAEVGGAVDRAEARIEAFRQTLKSLSVDLTRLALTTHADVDALAERARQVEHEVDLLMRTQQELTSLEGSATLDAPPASSAERDPASVAARAAAVERRL